MAKANRTPKKSTRAKQKSTKRNLSYWLGMHPLAGRLLFVGLFAVTGYLVSAWYFARAATTLTAIGTQISAGEGSGLVASRQYPGVFWWMRDGGTSTAEKPRDAIYAVKFDASGTPVPVKGSDKFPFFMVDGVKNNNWEDIALDEQNNVWVGDIGANVCTRQDQKLMKIKEPNPTGSESLTVLASYTFSFPDPISGCNTWNSEAMFWLDGKMYIFAKTKNSPVYRVDLPSGTSGRANLVRLGVLAGGVSNISVSSISDDRSRLMVASHEKMSIYKTSSTSLKGDALVKDLISRSPAYQSLFNTGATVKPAVEGGSFRRGSLDVAFVSENKYIYYGTPKSYGDTAATSTVDTKPPTVSITSPAANSTISGKITISVNASDNVSVRQVNILYDESGIIREGQSQGTYGWGSAFDTAGLSNGPHVLKAIAYDSAGNAAATEVPVIVNNGSDTTQPEVSITSPTNGAVVSGTIVINVSASDNVAVTSVNVLYDNGGIIREGTTMGNYGWGSAFNTSRLSNGLHTLKAVATDAAGNKKTAQIQVTVNN